MQNQRYRLTAQRAWQVFGSHYALTAPVLTILGIPAVVSVMVLYAGDPEGPLWLWWLLTAVSWGVPVLVLLVFRWTMLPSRERESRPILTLIAFVVAGVTRGAVLVPITIAMGIADVSTAVPRILGGALFTTMVLSLAALAVTAARTYQAVAGSLFATQQELEQLKLTMSEQIQRQCRDMVERAFGALQPTVSSLRNALGMVKNRQDAEQAAARLRDTVELVVRPLSQSLAGEPANIDMPPPVKRRRPRWRILVYPVPLGSFILPGSFVVLMFATSIGSLTTHVPMNVVVMALGIILATTYLVLWLARLVFRQVDVGFLVGVVLYVLIHLTIAVVGVLVVSSDIVKVPRNLVVGFIGVIIADSLFIYFFLGVEFVRQQALARQRETIAELNVAVSSLRQQLNVNAKRIANVLHGPVQSALFASALRLQQSDAPDDALVERILGDLDSALHKLAETDLERPNLDSFLAEIQQVWGETTSLDVIEVVPVRSELERDSTATQCVVEVIREGVNNAIKHGEASEIVVEFDRPEAGIIQVCVVNNGRVLTSLAPGGFGSSVLNEMTHEWSIRAVNGKTVLSAQVALNPNQVVSEAKPKE